ncbi:MAG: hypothetical protein ACJ786_26910, partial [Catenulispora sp.]
MSEESDETRRTPPADGPLPGKRLDDTVADNSVWLGSLGWATWIAASATVFGAVIASRLSSRPRPLWRLAL